MDHYEEQWQLLGGVDRQRLQDLAGIGVNFTAETGRKVETGSTPAKSWSGAAGSCSRRRLFEDWTSIKLQQHWIGCYWFSIVEFHRQLCGSFGCGIGTIWVACVDLRNGRWKQKELLLELLTTWDDLNSCHVHLINLTWNLRIWSIMWGGVCFHRNNLVKDDVTHIIWPAGHIITAHSLSWYKNERETPDEKMYKKQCCGDNWWAELIFTLPHFFPAPQVKWSHAGDKY